MTGVNRPSICDTGTILYGFAALRLWDLGTLRLWDSSDQRRTLASNYRIYSINSRAYYSKTSEKIRVREFIWMRVLLNGVC